MKSLCPLCGYQLFGKQDDEGMYLVCYNAVITEKFVKGCVWVGDFQDYYELVMTNEMSDM